MSSTTGAVDVGAGGADGGAGGGVGVGAVDAVGVGGLGVGGLGVGGLGVCALDHLGEVVLDEILPHPAGCTHELVCRPGTLVVVCRDLEAEWVAVDCPEGRA
ncbi:hypothetical protein RKD18_004358 [Streptomyces phaeoluteigriseus]